MQTASMTGFFRMILEIIIFYYVIKFLAKLFLPMLVKKAVEKAGEKFQQNQNHNTQFDNSENEIIINKKSDKPKETKKVGEYVDFEEIE